jgi:hypothetical protein
VARSCCSRARSTRRSSGWPRRSPNRSGCPPSVRTGPRSPLLKRLWHRARPACPRRWRRSTEPGHWSSGSILSRAQQWMCPGSWYSSHSMWRRSGGCRSRVTRSCCPRPRSTVDRGGGRGDHRIAQSAPRQLELDLCRPRWGGCIGHRLGARDGGAVRWNHDLGAIWLGAGELCRQRTHGYSQDQREGDEKELPGLHGGMADFIRATVKLGEPPECRHHRAIAQLFRQDWINPQAESDAPKRFPDKRDSHRVGTVNAYPGPGWRRSACGTAPTRSR